jgi:5'-3' exonuclease
MNQKTLLIVDGHALVYRAYHAFPKELTSPDGLPVGAAFGFCRILFSSIRTLKPTHLLVTFDTSAPTFRHTSYADYKATRSATPEELTAQLPVVHRIVDAMEAPVLSMDGYEADDLIGTVAHQVEKEHPDVRVIILSADQDLLQLVTDQTAVYSPGIAPKQPTLFTPAAVQEKYGFAPKQMIEYKALRGDPSDNLPGVPGIGEVTAKQLLGQFGTIDTLYTALEKGTPEGIKPGILQKLRDHQKEARLSRELATICVDAPLTFELDPCRLEMQHPENLVDIFQELNFKSLLSELPGSHKIAAVAADVFGSPTPEEAVQITTPPNSESAAFDAAVAPILRGMEERGVRVDTKYLAKLQVEFAEQTGALTEQLYEQAGQPFNTDSPQQVGHILYEVLKAPTTWVRKGKTGYTTDADTLNKLAAEFPIAKTLLTYRELTKLQNTYVKPLQEMVDEKSRVHTSYAPDTATGRISSRNPNLQNIPSRSEQGRRIRRAFTTDTGWELIAADYSQFELRIAAHLSQDPVLLEAFRSGNDFHSETAARVGVDRRTAKVINFSILYGKGAFSFANDLGISMDAAKQYIEQYFATFKGLRVYLDKVLQDSRERGYGETMYGRRRPFPDLLSSNYQRRAAAEREALNLPIQGSQADMLKKAMSDVDKAFRDAQSEANMILTVHDELVLECPKAEVASAAKLLVTTMEQAAQLDVPVIVEAKTGHNWDEMTPIAS